jgi:hypothetical protein
MTLWPSLRRIIRFSSCISDMQNMLMPYAARCLGISPKSIDIAVPLGS